MSGREKALSAAVRLAIFAALGLAGLRVLATLLYWLTGNLLVTSTVAVFVSAAIANALCMRIYEGATLAQAGLCWSAASRRHLALGL
ncbi:MAG: hypothetical protein ACPL88_10715, partial [Bryobacteraceae bacterium]